ncbi:MAG: hypothetical protein ACMXYD_01420 [Candidatus Woesearchaeota archaeon]
MLRDAINFMINLGVYDVVLPWLLVFTIMFALLEKTKVLGVEDGHSKKNLNAMVALVTGFIVVASTELVRVINTVLANVVLLLLLSVMFLLLVGSFGRDEEAQLNDSWKKALTGLMFIGIIVVFLFALGWLEGLWSLASRGIDGTVAATVLLIALLVGGMAWVVGGNNKGNKGGDSKK